MIVADWEQTRERFARVVFSRGVDRVAREIPADRSTVYRIVKPHRRPPTLAIRVRIEQIIDQDEKAKAKKKTP